MGYVFKLLVSAALVAGLVHFLDVGSALRHLAAVEPLHAAAAASLFFLFHILNAAKLRVMLPTRPVRTILAFILVAQAYALILPGQIAGEMVKAYRLARGTGTGGRVVSSVAFDKATSLMALLLIMLGGLVIEIHQFGYALFVIAATGLLAVVAAMALLSMEPIQGLALRAFAGLGLEDGQAAGLRGRLGWHLRGFLDAWRSHLVQPRAVMLSLLYGAAAQLTQAVATGILGRGLGIELSFALWCVVIGALTVLLLAPVTIGGLGLREASLVGMLGLLGVGEEQALAAAFAILAFQLLMTAAGLLIDLLVLRGR